MTDEERQKRTSQPPGLIRTHVCATELTLTVSSVRVEDYLTMKLGVPTVGSASRSNAEHTGSDQIPVGGARPDLMPTGAVRGTVFIAFGAKLCSSSSGILASKDASAWKGVEIPKMNPGNDGQVASARIAGVELVAFSSAALMSSLMAQ